MTFYLKPFVIQEQDSTSFQNTVFYFHNLVATKYDCTVELLEGFL